MALKTPPPLIAKVMKHFHLFVILSFSMVVFSMLGLVWKVCIGLEGLVWFGRFGLLGLVSQIWFGRLGLVGLGW